MKKQIKRCFEADYITECTFEEVRSRLKKIQKENPEFSEYRVRFEPIAWYRLDGYQDENESEKKEREEEKKRLDQLMIDQANSAVIKPFETEYEAYLRLKVKYDRVTI